MSITFWLAIVIIPEFQRKNTPNFANAAHRATRF